MIKKLQHIAIGSLAIFYMILSIGIEVDLHYCLGELKDIKVFNHQDEETKCCNDNVCSLERSFSCCDNEHLCYHIDDEQLTSKQLGKVNVNQQQGWLTTTSFSFQSNSNLYTNKAYLKAELEHQAQPAYLLNCAFIYYG